MDPSNVAEQASQVDDLRLKNINNDGGNNIEVEGNDVQDLNFGDEGVLMMSMRVKMRMTKVDFVRSFNLWSKLGTSTSRHPQGHDDICPSGKIMLLPEDDPNATHIMIATGTGVAPFRGYLRRMFMEAVPTFKFKGLAWLFLGVANSDSLLYDDEFSKYLRDYPDNFRFDRALSREQRNRNGGKMYVQDKIEEYGDEIFKLVDGGAHIYFCGLKGMMPGIQDTLRRVAEQRGESWDEKLSQLKRNKQWHVEVY